jgi:hemolysin activation/secretion protein
MGRTPREATHRWCLPAPSRGCTLIGAGLILVCAACAQTPPTADAPAGGGAVAAPRAAPGEDRPTTTSTVAEPRFEINRYVVEGTTLVDPAALSALLAPHTGKARRFTDIEAALDTVMGAYLRAGITAVQVLIPEQTLQDGVVRLRVEEMKVNRVEVDGVKAQHLARLRRAVPSLREGRTPVDMTLAQELRLANENPARRMEATFRTEGDDTLTAVLRVAERPPLVGLISLDNTGNASTGRWRLAVASQHANLLDHDIVGTAQFQTSPGHDKAVRIGALSVRVPWYGAGVMIDASHSLSNVDSGTVRTPAGDYFLASRGTSTGLRVTRLLPRWRGAEPRCSVGVDRRHVDSRISSGAGAPSLVPDIVLRPLTLGCALTLSTPEHQVQAQMSLSRNLPANGRSAASVFAEPGLRVGAEPRYTVVRGDLGATWPFGALALSLNWNGQWTRDALVSAEQFSAGGAGSVRGFDGRLASGDHGQRASLELAGPLPAQFQKDAWTFGWQVYADVARLGRHQAQAGEATTITVAGAGLGLRADWRGGLSLRADAATVTDGGGVAATGSGQVHVTASYGF